MLVQLLHLQVRLTEGHNLPSISGTEPGWGGLGLTSRPPAAASSLSTAAEPLLGTLSTFSFSNTESPESPLPASLTTASGLPSQPQGLWPVSGKGRSSSGP